MKIRYELLKNWHENNQTNNRNLVIVGLNSEHENEDDEIEQFIVMREKQMMNKEEAKQKAVNMKMQY